MKARPDRLKKAFSLRAHDELREKLDRIALSQRRKLSDLLRIILEDYCEANFVEDVPSPRKRSPSRNGNGKNGSTAEKVAKSA